MITFLKKLFGIEQKPKSKYDDFSVEHYPETGLYYPKYKSSYLKKHFRTGIVDLIHGSWQGITYGDKFQTESEAWRHIDLFIEQRFKENVKTIKR